VHQNKLLAVIVVVGGVLSSLGIISQMDIEEGECVTVQLPGDAGVKRCKEQSNITLQQTDKLKDLVVTQTNMEIQKINQRINTLSETEKNDPKITTLKQQIYELTERNKEILNSIPYLQQSDYDSLLQDRTEKLKEIKQSYEKTITNT